jgi:hypothetical protein
MSTLYVDTITEKTAGNGVQIPGHVVQVAHNRTSTRISTTSNAWQDTGIEITFTPYSATSKLLIIYDISVNIAAAGYSGNPAMFKTRIRNATDSTVIGAANGHNLWRFDIQGSGASGLYCYTHPSVQSYSDSWGTSAKTIRIQMADSEGGGVVFNETYPTGQDSGMTLMEIAQ